MQKGSQTKNRLAKGIAAIESNIDGYPKEPEEVAGLIETEAVA